MSFTVILLVLFGAFLHASWNAMVKAGNDKALASAFTALGASVSSLFALPFVHWPLPEAWPYVFGSVCIHFCYFQLVGQAYKHGDIGLVYPLMRGVAPLLVALTSGSLLGEHLTLGMMAGVLAISGGTLTLAFESRHGSRRAIGLALLNALVICSYTYMDGLGARVSGDPIAYTLWICILPPIPLFALAFFNRGFGPVWAYGVDHWWKGLVGGAASVGSYGLALYAMTMAPIAAVAALRETSILFALLISVLILKENASRWRYVAGVMIACGVLAMKLG